jgi:hypothetical protein
MGDRANICVLQEKGKKAIYFYTHWSGSELPELLQKGLILARGTPPESRGSHHRSFTDNRWDDESYLARIIFQALIGDDKGTTEFGIATYICDNEYPILVVDSDSQTVALVREKEIPTDTWLPPVNEQTPKWSFEAYCALKKPTWESLNP